VFNSGIAKLRETWKLWVAVGLSAGLLELVFPFLGPMPPWRAAFAWFSLVPLLCALLSQLNLDRPQVLRRSFLLAWFCGIVWYIGNCTWIYDTMLIHGDLPAPVSALLMLGFSLVLALYFGFFGLGVVLVQRAFGKTRLTLATAPFIWVALDMAASRITCVPWDQLGYSQVDNALVNQIAPWTGVYGVSFAVLVVNVLIVGGFLLDRRSGRFTWGISGAVLLVGCGLGVTVVPPRPIATETAVLVQPNLDVAADNTWSGPGEWDQHMAEYARLSADQCKTYIAGIPETEAPNGEIICPPYATHPALIVWPESPAQFYESDLRYLHSLEAIARAEQAPMVVGNYGIDILPQEGTVHDYNSALILGADGQRVGRYDKIHLVPFGEYIPYKNLLFFARKLTGRVSEFTRGDQRKVFRLGNAQGGAHRYGVFICYESVFGNEVREFALLGAEVLVNISDDGWYGDTSAPWQHLNMARMRAIENRRWILRDTNNGVTASIDPYGRVRQSIPRHVVDALPAGFAFRDDVTFYTAHGDLFGWLCAILVWGAVGWSLRTLLRRKFVQFKSKSGQKS